MAEDAGQKFNQAQKYIPDNAEPGSNLPFFIYSLLYNLSSLEFDISLLLLLYIP